MRYVSIPSCGFIHGVFGNGIYYIPLLARAGFTILPKKHLDGKSWEGIAEVEKIVYSLANEIIPFVETKRELNQAIDMLRLMLRRRLQKKQQSQRRESKI